MLTTALMLRIIFSERSSFNSYFWEEVSIMRIQFYPSQQLEDKLVKESTDIGVNISVLVNDILNKHYELIPPNNGLTDVQIEQIVFDELRAYVKKASVEDEFDLNKASTTYCNIAMVYAGKPQTLKARLGKKFAGMVGANDFVNVEQVLIEGKPKRTVGNRAAIYRIIDSTRKNDMEENEEEYENYLQEELEEAGISDDAIGEIWDGIDL